MDKVTGKLFPLFVYPVFLLGLIMLATATHAEIYKWVDSQGRTQFSDRPVNGKKTETVRISTINTMTPVNIPEDLFAHNKAGSAQSLPSLARGEVIIYSTPSCGYCGQAKDYMHRNNISYREKDITRSASAKSEFSRLGGRGVPLILVGTADSTRKLNGFNESSFRAVYPLK